MTEDKACSVACTGHCAEASALRIRVGALEREQDKATAIIRQCLEALIASHPRPTQFKDCLEDRSIDRYMWFATPAVFDPNGRVRAAIAARDYLAEDARNFAAPKEGA